MAEQDTGQERSQDATPKRIRDARAKGDVARSRELNTVLMLLASMVGFAVLGGTGVTAYKQLAKNQWHIERDHLYSDQALLNGFLVPFVEALWISAPFLLLMFLAAFVGPMCMGGWVFSASSLKIDMKKLSPLAGLKRMFGIQSLAELLKAVMKVILLGVMSVVLFQLYTDDYLLLATMPIAEAVSSMFGLMFIIVLILVLTLGLVALVDVPYQQWSYAKKLRMTLQEVREENKEQQGNPEVKAKVRQMQQGYANRKMLLDVPTADVVIVNPTHYSVALKYDDDAVAPIVVAKGVDNMAFRIRELAKDADVAIFSAPPLARALYRHADVGDNIPGDLYLAVAQVLAYVLQIKKASFADQRRMVAPTDLPIPKSFQDPQDT
ncbi:MAG: flagellar biosynthesis protein FlhB [Granulosicoccus sp.]